MSKPLSELIEDHLERLRSLNYSPCTVRQAGFDLRALARWLMRSYRITDPDGLRQTHLRAWHRSLTSRRTRSGRPIKARSVNKRIHTVRGFLKFLAAEGYIPAQLVQAVEIVKEPKLLPASVLTHEQVRRLLDGIRTDTAEGFRNRVMLEVLYSGGMRVAELLGLDIDSVDLANRTAMVMGKGQKERMVPLGRTAVRLLETYIKAVRPYLVRGSAGQALFLDAGGRRVPYHTFRRIVHACAARAGLEVRVTPHTFRRSCATEMLRSGAGMYHVKELLGHESLDTLKHYARLTITDLKKVHARCHPRERDTRP